MDPEAGSSGRDSLEAISFASPLPSPFLFTSQLSAPLFFLSAIVSLALGDSPTTFLPSFFLLYTRTRFFADSVPWLDSCDHFTPPLFSSNDQYKSTVLILATVDRVSSNKPRLASLFSSESLPASDKISSCLFSTGRDHARVDRYDSRVYIVFEGGRLSSYKIGGRATLPADSRW